MVIGPFSLPDRWRGTGFMDTHTHSEVFESSTPIDVVMLYGHTHAEYEAGYEYTLFTN